MSGNGDTDLFTDPRFEDTTCLNVILFDDDDADDSGAQLKASFFAQAADLGGEKQPQLLIDEIISAGGLAVRCDLAQIIHGTMIQNGSPATLVVFQFAFVPLKRNRRFKEVEITITLSAGDVQSISPFNHWTLRQSVTERKLSHKVSPNLEAAFGAGKASLGYEWQFEENKKIEGYASVVGSFHSLGEARTGLKKRNNTIIWGLHENGDTNSGIPTFVQTAALLTRDKTPSHLGGEEFSAEITISGEVDDHKLIKDKWERVTKSMTGKSRKGEAVIFDPKQSRGAVSDANNLAQVKLDTYKSLVDIRPWEEGGEKRQEQDPAGRETAEQKPLSQPASSPTDKPVTISATLGATVARTPVETAALASPQAVDVSSKQPHTPPPETVIVTHTEATFSDRAVKEQSASPDGDGKQQILRHLQDDLRLVRREADLVHGLVGLVREERRLLKDIRRLGG